MNHEIVVNTIASALQLGQAHPTAIEYASALTSAARFHPFDTPIPASIAAIVCDGHPGTPSPDERAEAIDWTQRTLGGTANALINATPQELLDGLERIELGLAKPDKDGNQRHPDPDGGTAVRRRRMAQGQSKRAKELPVHMIEGRPGRIQVRVVGKFP